jgi:hypothetical protein
LFQGVGYIFLVSEIGIFVYKVMMSSEAKAKWGSVGVSFSLLNISLLFSILYVLGKGVSCLILHVKSLSGELICWGTTPVHDGV